MTPINVSGFYQQGGGDYPSSVTFKKIARQLFLRNRLAAGYGTLYVPNTGTVFYIDPSVAGPGTGTLIDPFKVLPATVTNGATYLFIEGSFISISTAITGTGLGSSTVFGTYEAYTGKRVLIELGRLATISFTSALTSSVQAFTLSTTNTNVTFSGLRITCPDVLIGDRRGIYTGSTSNNISPIIEYCYFDTIDSRAALNGLPGGSAIFSFSNNTTVRFNTFRNVIADQIWVGVNAGAGGEGMIVIGNDIIIPDTLGSDGPDCIQHSTDHATKHILVTDNWCELSSNQKQCLITSGSGYVATDSAYVTRNVFWGSDLSSVKVGANNSKTVEWQGYNTVFESNIVRGGQYGINLAKPSKVKGNIFICDQTTIADGTLTNLTQYFGVVLSAGSGDVNEITNNTFIRLNGQGGVAIHTTATITANVVANNIVYGGFAIGIRRDVTGTTEINNVVYLPTILFANSASSSVASAGSFNLDPKLDALMRPKSGSPAYTSASSTYYKPYTDIHGTPARKDTPIAGAVYG